MEHNRENSENFDRKTPFSVPENYFEKLTQRIQNKIELRKISSFLSEVKKENPFKVPENYFENFEINNTFFSLKKNSFTVPESYFENLYGRISEQIKEDAELSIRKTNPFKVPENYFENLNERILQKTFKKREAKIIGIGDYFKEHKYAIAMAASIALLVAFYFFNFNKTYVSEKELLVSAEEITNSIYVEEFDEATIIEEINETSLQENSSEFENYLIDNYIDENAIISEL